ncbi:hypothetical protein ACSBR1_026516 [Camellia fascicularis]
MRTSHATPALAGSALRKPARPRKSSNARLKISSQKSPSSDFGLPSIITTIALLLASPTSF